MITQVSYKTYNIRASVHHATSAHPRREVNHVETRKLSKSSSRNPTSPAKQVKQLNNSGLGNNEGVMPRAARNRFTLSTSAPAFINIMWRRLRWPQDGTEQNVTRMHLSQQSRISRRPASRPGNINRASCCVGLSGLDSSGRTLGCSAQDLL